MTPILFLAGTDTDVGKTYASCLVIQAFRLSGKRVGVYKPVASGCHTVDEKKVSEDALSLWQAAGSPLSLDDVCPQKFSPSLAPPEAASQEDLVVDADLLRNGADPWLQGQFDLLLVEGAGGLMSPLSDNLLNIDLFHQFNSAKLIIVAANRLGAIHQTVSTCEAARHHGVEPAGIILSQVSDKSDGSMGSNKRSIERFSGVPVLAELSNGQQTLPLEVLDQIGLA